jgi:hypothetical protein
MQKLPRQLRVCVNGLHSVYPDRLSIFLNRDGWLPFTQPENMFPFQRKPGIFAFISDQDGHSGNRQTVR